MKLISKKINFDQISIFTIISFFLLTISFLISKSFIENEEISDYIFTLSTIILFELSFLILLNNLQKFKIKSRGDFFLYTIVFILIFLLWNYSISNNFIDFTSFILFHILIISFVILSEYNSKEIKNISLSTVFTYLLFSFLLSGIFYQFENNSNSELLEIILITFSYYLILKLIKKDSSLIQSVLSVVVFIVLLKVFLLSAEKDSFHYSWWLGPINSSIVGNELLTDTVSQYGYLSILIVDKFSNLTNFETEKSFLILITIFFIIFFYIFVREALSNIRYPFFLIVLFSSLLIFGNIGSSNLSGAMLIPSSSVYRFLPSLLTIYFLSKIIINHKKNYHINLASFFSLLLISTIWSFESLFFISFCLISTFSLGLLYLFFDKKKYKKNNKFEFYKKNKHYFFSYLGFYIIFLLIFFIIFFYIFVREALSNIRYPFFLIVLFSSLLIFGNIGSSNLSGAMLIPSSSVYRFLPSLLTIYFLSKIIINHKKNYHINLASFFSLLLISTIWSFESLFFISFCLISTFSLGLLYLFFDKKKYKKNNKFEFYKKNKHYFFSYLGFYIIFLFLITWNKDLVFFYEHALNLKTAALSKEIINSRNTLLFLTFLFVNFILLRASFNPLKIRIFFYNLLWFSLFISFTSYFIVRSHSNNVFSLLPFFIFFILMLKTNSLIIKEYKTIFIKIFIFFVIVSSATSSYLNREIFLNKLMLKTFLKAPLYDYEQYIPSNKIQIRLNENKNIPVTLISGSTIHSLNKTLNYGGYGLPILPLEQFNRLSFNRKDFLMNKYFKKNNKHYVLCLIDCEFYTRNIKMTNWSNIYLSANVNAVVVSSSKNIGFSETLYLLNLKN